MASIYLGLNRGSFELTPDEVTEGSSTGSTDVELRIDTGKSMYRKDVVILVEALLRYLVDGRTNVFPL